MRSTNFGHFLLIYQTNIIVSLIWFSVYCRYSIQNKQISHIDLNLRNVFIVFTFFWQYLRKLSILSNSSHWKYIFYTRSQAERSICEDSYHMLCLKKNRIHHSQVMRIRYWSTTIIIKAPRKTAELLKNTRI